MHPVVEKLFHPRAGSINQAARLPCNQPQDDLYSISQTPQVWLDHQVMERNGELHFNWDVVEQLFEPALMDQMFQCYCQLLHALAQRPQLWHEQSWRGS